MNPRADITLNHVLLSFLGTNLYTATKSAAQSGESNAHSCGNNGGARPLKNARAGAHTPSPAPNKANDVRYFWNLLFDKLHTLAFVHYIEPVVCGRRWLACSLSPNIVGSDSDLLGALSGMLHGTNGSPRGGSLRKGLISNGRSRLLGLNLYRRSNLISLSELFD